MNGGSKMTPQENRKVESKKESNNMMCLGGEEEFDRIMNGDFTAFNRTDCALRFNEVFHWAWESWRAAVGNKIAPIYSDAIDLMNIGAKVNGKIFVCNIYELNLTNDIYFIQKGYNDIGEVWREEIDLPNLQEVIDLLMHEIRPFYRLLHGILRNVLWQRINKFEPFLKKSTIPAHMLGLIALFV